MKAQELRIGNWIKRKSGGYQQVLEVLSTMVLLQNDPPLDVNKTMTVPLRSIEPIPLTPERLEKFGFEFKGDNEYHKEISWSVYIVIDSSDFSMALYDNAANYKKGNYVAFGRPNLMLHDLQNIIYDLTGEELQIEL